MKKIILLSIFILLFSSLSAAQPEGTMGVDFGYLHGWSPSGDDKHVTSEGGNIGFHYEPPVSERFNISVSARVGYLYSEMDEGVKVESSMILPSLTAGSKFLLDMYQVIPYFGWGVGGYMNIASVSTDGDSDSKAYFGFGGHVELGSDLYVSDDFSVGMEARFDHVFKDEIPDMFMFNLRVNFATLK